MRDCSTDVLRHQRCPTPTTPCRNGQHAVPKRPRCGAEPANTRDRTPAVELSIAPNGLSALAVIGADEAVRRMGIQSWTGKRLGAVSSPPRHPH
jgi:hypothetical protein